MKIIIAGGRDFNDSELMHKAVSDFMKDLSIESFELVCGEAYGADSLGKALAEANDFVIHSFPADWKTFGKSAGYRRNVAMGEFADRAIIFWDGKSKGTKHMIDIMNSKKKPYWIINY